MSIECTARNNRYSQVSQEVKEWPHLEQKKKKSHWSQLGGLGDGERYIQKSYFLPTVSALWGGTGPPQLRPDNTMLGILISEIFVPAHLTLSGVVHAYLGSRTSSLMSASQSVCFVRFFFFSVPCS